MHSLAEWQQQFIAALTRGDGTPAALSVAMDARSPDAHVRLQVYRNNWRSNLCNALRIAYPVVERLVGAAFFAWMADRFIDAQPSRSGNLDDYGRELPDFIRQFPAAQALPYLGDVALLEQMIDIVMAAPDIPDENGVPLPVAQLLASAYPIRRIWQVNQADWAGDASVLLAEGGEFLLIQRTAQPVPTGAQFNLFIQTLTAEQFADMQSAARNATMETRS